MHDRRRFLKSIGAASVASVFYRSSTAAQNTSDLPNILWITCEDISANLGCYGDSYARTPNLDKLASEGTLYTNAYATAPVCSPARSCIITGVHACSLGTQHLRSTTRKPDAIRCFTELLREAGYYCTNNSKQDYQFRTPKNAWDESSRTAHWRKRPPNRPFFSVFNLALTHQSKTRYPAEQLRKVNDSLPSELRHDPTDAPLPPYYADTQLIRENVAAYHTQITLMDREVGKLLKELDTEGLSDKTIVFFYSDHGAGIPRAKRWLHHNGIRVPFMIRCPEKYRHLVPGKSGAKSNRLVSFVDLAPTMLSLTGIPLPGHLQGKAFLGKTTGKPRDLVFASRDRVDEVILCSRTVIDGKYQYIRNFLPHRPRMPLSWYSEKTPIRAELRRLNSEGKLKGPEAWLLARTTPAEELYDLSADTHQMNNLAESETHADALNQMREILYTRMQEIRDTGLLPESEMRSRYPDGPYEGMHRLSESEYVEILDTARLVGMGNEHTGQLIKSLSHDDSAVRYWAAVGLAVMGAEAGPVRKKLQEALSDPSPNVRIASAEALCILDMESEALPVLARELKTGDDATVIEAATVLFAVGSKATPIMKEIQAAKRRRLRYAGSALDHVLNNLK